MIEATEGYDGDPKLVKVFETECRGGPDCHLSQIIEGPIYFSHPCEHHCLPFYGVVYVGYISHEHIIGISKLTRLVHLFRSDVSPCRNASASRSPILSTSFFCRTASPSYIEAHHLCVEMRGVKEISPITRTTFWRGNYDSDPALRAEFICAVRKQTMTEYANGKPKRTYLITGGAARIGRHLAIALRSECLRP